MGLQLPLLFCVDEGKARHGQLLESVTRVPATWG